MPKYYIIDTEFLISSRNKLGLSQRKLAELMDCSRNQLNRWENSYTKTISSKHIRKLTKIFNCKIKDIKIRVNLSKSKFPDVAFEKEKEIYPQFSSDCETCIIFKCRGCPVATGYVTLLGKIINEEEKIELKESLNL